MATYQILTNEQIMDYLTSLISKKAITLTQANTFAEKFYAQCKISEEQYQELKLLIEVTY